MKRWMIALSMTAALCMSAMTAQAGPGCCGKSKDANAKDCNSSMAMAKRLAATLASSRNACKDKCGSGGVAFPTIERKFVVGDDIYDTEAQAWEGLAKASEAYVGRFTSIACVVDGKVVYCDEQSGDKCCKSGDAAKVTLASMKGESCKSACDKSTCDGAAKASLAKAGAEEPDCCKAKLPCCEKAKAEGRKGNCCSGEEKAEKATLTSLTAGEKGSCDKSKASCASKTGAKDGCCKDGAAKTKLASAECDKDKSCCKAKLASADGADKACCKAKLASLTDGEKGSCDKSKASCASKTGAKDGCCKDGAAKTKLASAECDKDKSCCKAKLASADGADKACCKAKLASLKDGEKGSCDKSKASCASKTGAKDGCCKDGAAKTKLASAECDKDKSCCKAKLASADGADKACCKAKLASLTDGEKGSCDKSKASCASKTGAKDGCCKDGAAKTKLADGKSCCDGENVIYRVAGRDYSKWEDAVVARDVARAAIGKVAMSYIVEGKKVDNAADVCPTAKAAGKVKFVVGKTTTSCELHARVELAKARIEAARTASAGEKVATR